MDANQVGFVHELTGKTSRPCSTTPSPSSRAARCRCSSRAASRRCRPTSWTRFATRARLATTACRPRPTASSSPRARSSAQQAAEAGLRYAYLQFDGIGNAANSHRKVGNLFDVKLQAIENLHEAGVEIVPVITIVNGINNEQVGAHHQVRARQSEEDRLPLLPAGVALPAATKRSPTSAGRRSAIRCRHLAHDVKNQTGLGEPTRDWFPISLHGHLLRLGGPDARTCNNDWGQLTCGCHPNCGIGMAVMIDKETKEAVPVTAFLNGDQLAKDVAKINDAARSKFWSGHRHGAVPDAELRSLPVAHALQADATC